MRYIFMIFCTFLFLFVNAQIQNEMIKVSYNYHHYSPTGNEINSQMLLISSKEGSKFFSPLNEKVDSMMSTSEGRIAYSQMVQAAMAKNEISNIPIKKEPVYVIKSRKDNLTSVYDLIGADYWVYEEPLIPQEWIITDSIDKILSYDCIEAICNYRDVIGLFGLLRKFQFRMVLGNLTGFRVLFLRQKSPQDSISL